MAAVICCVLIVPLVRTPQNFIRARDFALSRRPRNADIPTVASLSRHSLCPRAYVEKATHCETDSLSLSLFPVCVSPRLTHVHTSTMACLFAPCANCCILHACEAISLFLILFPHLAFIFSLSLSFLSLIVSLFLHFASSVATFSFAVTLMTHSRKQSMRVIFLLII